MSKTRFAFKAETVLQLLHKIALKIVHVSWEPNYTLRVDLRLREREPALIELWITSVSW